MEPVSSGRNRTGQLNRRQIGAGHEEDARRYLEQAGLIWVGSNVHFRNGELDLIMRDGHCWVFVEVRYRRDAGYGGALASLTRNKQQKLLRAAALWLAQRGGSFETVNCRFDIIAITGTALEWLPKDKHIGLLIVPGRADAHTESVTSDVAVRFANSMLHRFDVDWAGLGFSDADLDELAEHLLRIIQSFVIDPGRPPRQGAELRDYLRRWVGSAVRA